MSTLSWVSGTAGGSFIFGVLITSILVAYNPSYSPQPYQTTFFVFAVALVQGLADTVGASQLPRFQKDGSLHHCVMVGQITSVYFLICQSTIPLTPR
jgi:hypothetical protein